MGAGKDGGSVKVNKYNKCKKILKSTDMETENFTWIPFYEELADKLLMFKNDRPGLMKIVWGLDKKYIRYITDNSKLKDIDPFTVFSIFNRGLKQENRIDITRYFKKAFSMEADIPENFNGVPFVMLMKAMFVAKDDANLDVQPLWDLLDYAINDNIDGFTTAFDSARKLKGVKWNITMGLYWIRPRKFIALDNTNRKYLSKLGFEVFNEEDLNANNYLSLLKEIQDAIKNKEIAEKDIPAISFNAWKKATDIEDNANSESDSIYSEWIDIWKSRKNIVLYGAPGTGKTYDVPELVVRLCCPNFDAEGSNRTELMTVYKKLKAEKRVAFTTFHQSMDYEEWMEGLRPNVNDENGQVSYNIETGIFKSLCNEAEKPIITNKEIKIDPDAVIWKVSLSGTGDNPVRSDCMKNNYIRIGWDYYGAEINDDTDWAKHNNEGKGILDTFINKMKIGDVVMSCYSNHSIDAIGVVTGEYVWNDKLPHHKRTRAVKWLVKGINEDIVEMNDGKVMTLGTVYRLSSITLENVKTILDKYKQPQSFETNNRPYVMVIDEMNRGNVSKIFGELITLLEVDKRKGAENEESVILPYSKKSFSIPSNVFIIATMNTADRSLGTLDYAVRRRFAFIADKPWDLGTEDFDSELFEYVSRLFVRNYDDYKKDKFNPNFKMERAETLSEDFKPEDVWIGHSYFIMKDEKDKRIRLLYEIIPLLEEYVRDGVLNNCSEVQNVINDLREKADL